MKSFRRGLSTRRRNSGALRHFAWRVSQGRNRFADGVGEGFAQVWPRCLKILFLKLDARLRLLLMREAVPNRLRIMADDQGDDQDRTTICWHGKRYL